MTNEEIVEYCWHWIVEDKLGFQFAEGMMIQNGLVFDEEIDADKIELAFKEYFLDRFGIELFSNCPKCTGKIVMRNSRYGEFMACDKYPSCKNIYTDKSRRTKK